MATTILTIETPSLGDRSYLAHDGEVAFVVDPQRDIDRVLDEAARAGVRITHVFETHLHNDYVTGGYALAQETGASYFVNGEDEVSFQRTPILDGQAVEVSPTMRVRAIHTPGHTFTHLSYVLEGREPAVFSGGSLLFGSTGRPDLLGEAHTDDLARHQYRSARRLAAELSDETSVMPTHGFGSFCAATSAGADATASTIGQERLINPVMSQDEEDFVAATLAGLDAYPAYYVHMGPANAAGPSAGDLSEPERADKEQIRRRLEAGEWLVDLRTRTAFAAGHVPGTFNFGLDGQFATYLGWLIPWGSPVTLLAESPEQIAEAQRELGRIGIDRPAAAATGRPEEWTDGPLATLPSARFADLAQVRHHRSVTVLDVRRVGEWREAHIDGAVHIPLHDVVTGMEQVPEGEVWVHCASGYRASIAASLIAATGRHVVVVDDSFDLSARAAGLPVVAEAPASA
ncbi:rhodanese-like domain-containing protein [Cellulomonas fimi]|uniref:MBL fold metallo-hydrolase n=1 Tax=Cellulomonas fimi TaxID=1708 RepID=A0A7Y0LZ00_CELFI|nr:MBL fold metallo-hydrolase [Cellulomonas fimi]NMR20495.1 MBL fold metallo-hydrolase [Cellulomonas fimi]